MKTLKNIFNPNKLSTLVLYLSILLFIIAFNFAHNPPNGWYQQFMPNIGNRQISDIFFLDSLTAWSVNPYVSQNDTAFILKTTNGGDNWYIQLRGAGEFVGMNRINFINSSIGFSCGAGLYEGSSSIMKSTNGGDDWFSINPPDMFADYEDMSILNEDTILLVNDIPAPSGGVFRTSNGGINWQQQFSGGGINPNKIYMFDKAIGFMCNDETGNHPLYKTTNSGQTWNQIPGGPFTDMYFVDSLTGWKSLENSTVIKKTTNGGLNWIDQALPQGGNVLVAQMIRFSNINKDTLWGVGGTSRSPIRGILYRTTNQGQNWFYQIPDTNIRIGRYSFVNFFNKQIGWAYSESSGIHTKVGGDSIFTKIKTMSNTIPGNFILYQSYPNPFNPNTIINYELRITNFVTLKVYSALGKEIQTLVNQKLHAGKHQIEFDAGSLPSGVYFYSLFINGDRIDTKRMVLVR